MYWVVWWVMGAAAQTPSERWNTVKTEHFRVHYPEVAEPWSLDMAGRLEEWHRRVTEEVGYVPPQRIDIVVVDPYSDANGLALPLSGGPRSMLFASPPDAASVIGHYRSWGEILVVHEDTHLVHMLRPPRNTLERIAYELFGVGPVASKSPRWVTEGYATVVEGRLTGFGRPNGDYRALFLRRLAQRGQLPTYSQLDGGGRWAGGSFAYLVGSAYLEWLEERTGEGSLRALWARMTAKRMRPFPEAFAGVFGAPPDELYGRFVAEITASAMEIEEEIVADEQTLLSLGWNVMPFDISADGKKIAVPVFPKQGKPRLDVYEVAVDEGAVKGRLSRREGDLERDPEDVAAVLSGPPPHKRLHQRISLGLPAREVRFLQDGSGLLFSAWDYDTSGRVRPDLYRWTFPSDQADDQADPSDQADDQADPSDQAAGEEDDEASIKPGVKRLTRRQDLRTPDPAPDGTWAVAVRVVWGQTQIVRVDLQTGQWAEITPLSNTQVDMPRVSPDGQRLAWLSNDGSGYGVIIRELSSGTEWKSDPVDGNSVASSIAWGEGGTSLLATVGRDGFVEVHELWREGGRGRGALTKTAGGAWMADPIDDDQVAFLSISHKGFDLNRATLTPEQGARPSIDAAPVARPRPPTDAPDMPPLAPLEPKPYGLGPVDLSPLGGASLTSAALYGQAEIGVRLGDPVGRHDLLLLGSYGSPTAGGLTGGRLSWSWRGLPVDLRFDATIGGDVAFQTRRAGLSLSLDRDWYGRGSYTALGLGILREQALAEDPYGDRSLAQLRSGFSWIERNRAMFGFSLTGRAATGAVDGSSFVQLVGGGTLRLISGGLIRASYDLGWSNGDSLLSTFSLGGLPSSASTSLADGWRIFDPAFGADVVSARVRDRMELALETGLSPYIVRHRFSARATEGLTAVGLRARQSIDRQPFFKVPEGSIDVGAACRIEYPGLGLDRQPCIYLDDWAGWLSVTFER